MSELYVRVVNKAEWEKITHPGVKNDISSEVECSACGESCYSMNTNIEAIKSGKVDPVCLDCEKKNPGMFRGPVRVTNEATERLRGHGAYVEEIATAVIDTNFDRGCVWESDDKEVENAIRRILRPSLRAVACKVIEDLLAADSELLKMIRRSALGSIGFDPLNSLERMADGQDVDMNIMLGFVNNYQDEIKEHLNV